MKLARVVLVLAVIALVAAPNAARAQLYHLIDLGAAGTQVSRANAINASGRVAGEASLDNVYFGAFRTPAYMPIDPVAGFLPIPFDFSAGYAINDAGVVAGQMHDIGAEARAFTYGTPLTDLGTLGFLGSIARGINSSGRVVGELYTGSVGGKAFDYYHGVMRNLGTLGGDFSIAYGINASGRIVGSSAIKSGEIHAFRTAPNSVINSLTDDLGTLGGDRSSASAINIFDVVVGTARDALGHDHAFRFSGGVMTDLGTLPGSNHSFALAINASGKVVGISASSAVLFTGGVVVDLNDVVGPTAIGLAEATGINDSGAICGWGYADGQPRGFILRPIEPLRLTITPNRVAGCLNATGRVTLNFPAPADLAVTLTDVHPDAACPATVTVLAGQTTASFTITTTPVANNSVGFIRATYGGVTRSASLTVMPISVRSVTFAPSSVVGCKECVGTVTLECPPTLADILVTLVSADPSLVGVPESVVVPIGSMKATFPVTTSAVKAATSVFVTAKANDRFKTGKLTLKPIPPKSVTLFPMALTGGASSAGKVTLECPAGPGDITVKLSSSNAVAKLPSMVVVPMGATSADFTIDTTKVGAITKVLISANANGVTRSATLTVNP
jgi:probable HAF family extracellular repeat protein